MFIQYKPMKHLETFKKHNNKKFLNISIKCHIYCCRSGSLGKRLWDEDLCACSLLGSALRINTWVEEGKSKLSRKKLSSYTVTIKASVDSFNSFGARMAYSIFLKAQWLLDLYIPQHPVMGHRGSQKRGFHLRQGYLCRNEQSPEETTPWHDCQWSQHLETCMFWFWKVEGSGIRVEHHNILMYLDWTVFFLLRFLKLRSQDTFAYWASKYFLFDITEILVP